MNKNLFLLIFVVCAVAFFLVIIKQAKAEKGYNPEVPDFPMPKAQPNPSNPSAKPKDYKSRAKDYQQFFKDRKFKGLNDSEIVVDGIFGKNSEKAYSTFITEFSNKTGLKPTGDYSDVVLYISYFPFGKFAQSTNPFRKTF